MDQHPEYYQLTEERDGIEPGTVFRIVARYGAWHPHDAKLEVTDDDRSDTVQVTLEELSDSWEAVERAS